MQEVPCLSVRPENPCALEPLQPSASKAAGGAGAYLRPCQAGVMHGGTTDPAAAARVQYFLDRKNGLEEIHKLDLLLRLPRVLLEIGCGSADAARRIAQKNPDMGVIATDRFGGSRTPSAGSGYEKIARAWRGNRLSVQIAPLPNLVVLRAEADLLACLPARSLDAVLLVNPEPAVGRAFLARLRDRAFSSRIKRGPRQVVILPFSREMGMSACGGFGFDHDSDWSRGLGFIMGSGLAFRPGRSEQWGVDLTTLSAYTRSSTQRTVYVWGASPA